MINIPTLFSRQQNLLLVGASPIARALLTLMSPYLGRVWIIDRDGSMVPASADFLQVDLEDTVALEERLRALEERVDCVVHCARWRPTRKSAHQQQSDFDAEMRVNFRSATIVGNWVLQQQQDQAGKHSARVLLFSSVASLFVGENSASYHASKASIEGYCRWLAVRGGACNLRANALAPGFILQDRYNERYQREDNSYYREIAEFAHPQNKVGSENDIALSGLFLLSDWAQFITGQVLTVDGGLTLQDPFSILLKRELSSAREL